MFWVPSLRSLQMLLFPFVKYEIQETSQTRNTTQSNLTVFTSRFADSKQRQANHFVTNELPILLLITKPKTYKNILDHDTHSVIYPQTISKISETLQILN